MELSQLVHMFDGEPADIHTLEVGLEDVRRWHGDMQEIMRINNGLREALLEVGVIVNKTVR
jgi:hypothetical protein